MEKLFRVSIAILFMLSFTAIVVAEEQAAEESGLAVEENSGEGVITGVVTAVDIQKATVTVNDPDSGEKTFLVVDGETILWKGVDDIVISGIEKGNEAEVGYYTDEKGKLIASWIDLFVAEDSMEKIPESETISD